MIISKHEFRKSGKVTLFLIFFFIYKQLECQKKCAHLVEIETKEKSDWLMTKFLLKGKLSSCYIEHISFS